ncbi:hypothetical protein P9112_008764 [Eukaryota sp. TZLM1-RC]
MGAGLFRVLSFFRKRECRILLVGLDNAGKTSILQKLKFGESISTIPTIGFNVDTVRYKNLSINIFDVGGQKRLRSLWKHYYANSNAVIFVVDSSDVNRMTCNEDRCEEGCARCELHYMMASPELQDSILLVFANKQDLPEATSASEVAERLQLSTIKHKHHIVSSCAISGDGLFEGLDFIVNELS